MTRADRIALLLSVSALVVAALVTWQVFEGLPHLEDEFTYIWQAQAITQFDLTVPSPVCPSCFMVPFVADHEGLRFGKYPPGWPAALSIGIRLDARDLVNPLLAALCVWLTYSLVKRLLNEKAALLAAFLTLTSPFFLVNAGTLLPHIWSYFLTLAFILAWLDLTDPELRLPTWLPVTTAGLTLGLLALTRPLTAAAVALPFFIHGVMLLIRGNSTVRKRIIGSGVITAILASMILVWQYALSGDPFTNPYTLYWPYDRLGFGPGIGVQEGGNSPYWAWINTKNSLRVGASDLFGWPMISWLFMPFGLFAIRKNKNGLLVSSILLTLVLAYTLYWIGSWVLGPRYYFEGLIAAVLLTAAGIQWLAGSFKPLTGRRRENIFAMARKSATAAVAALLITGNLVFYLPQRLSSMTLQYDISSAQLMPFRTTTALDVTPALIIVHQKQQWREYATLLELSNPYLDTPFIFVYSRGSELDQTVIDAYPSRSVYHYYADEPYKFYEQPRIYILPEG